MSDTPQGPNPHLPRGPSPGAGLGRARLRTLLAGAVVVSVAVVAGAAVLAFHTLGSGGQQPAEALPADVLGYVRVDLDPSTSQKITAARLVQGSELDQVTGFSADPDDLRRRLYEMGVRGHQGCPSYEDGVQPWISDRAGFGAMPNAAGHEPDPVAVLQVTDQEAARPGIEAIAQCTGQFDVGVAFVGEYALVAETQELAERIAAEAERAPLSEDPGYRADMEALDGVGFVSAWVDVEAAGTAYGTGGQLSRTVAAGLDEVRSMAVALRAAPDSLELVVAVEGLAVDDVGTVDAVGALPESTMLALGFTGGVVDLVARVQQTGLAAPDGLRSLFGEDVALALDGDGLQVDAATGAVHPASARFGMRSSGDATGAGEPARRIETAAAFTPLHLVGRNIADGAVVATSEQYANLLATHGGLGESDTYRAAVASPDDAAAVAFADIDALSAVLHEVGRATDDDALPVEALEVLAALRAIGMSATVDGDYTEVSFRVIFD